MTKYIGRHRAGASDIRRGRVHASRRSGIPAALAATAVAGAGMVPASALETGIGASTGPWENNASAASKASAPKTVAPRATEVQRFTASVGYQANIRSEPTLRNPKVVVAKVPSGTPLTGSYNSTGYWFRVTKGKWAGRWIAGSLLQGSSRASDVNGLMPQSHLAPLPEGSARQAGAARSSLARGAVRAFADMNDAFKARFGHDLGVVEGYRTLATQKLYANRFGFPRAAIPGTSNHGFGNAIDVGQAGRAGSASPFYFGHVYDRWLTDNAWKWGFDRPDAFDAGGNNPEFWHYNFVG